MRSTKRRNHWRQRRLTVESLEHRCMLSSGYGEAFALFTDETLQVPGLVGSYVDQSLRAVDERDWRATRAMAGTRVDPVLFFQTPSLGARSQVGITGGSDADWDNFSVQWDGVVQILKQGTRLTTHSDDSSRMWIDINRDGAFDDDGPELIDNHWGRWQPETTGPLSVPLAAGVYPVRIQYQEEGGGNRLELVAQAAPIVRVAYVVPDNRQPQPGAEAAVQDYVPRLRDWYAEQMDRFGFGPKTFDYETEADGITPRVHTVHVGVTDEYLRQDIWGHTLSAAATAGIPIWSRGEIWLVFPESHLQLPDGSVIGGTALGAGYGSGDGGGVAMLGTDALFRLTDARLTDDTPYAGEVVPEIGPYPLVQDVSFPWFEYSTFSSIASSIQGALAHELGHAFGLPHDFRNDSNFRGTLMGNGLRGFRGAMYPERYPSDDMRLSYGAALSLNVSAYFNPRADAMDSSGTDLVIRTGGEVAPVDGLLHIDFTAADEDGLAAALLQRGGDTIGEMPLSGASVDAVFATPYYTPGTEGSYSIAVVDAFGNRHQVWFSVTASQGYNRAPEASFTVFHSHSRVGQPITLDASPSFDADDPAASLLVEWDLDGDGAFDTPPTTLKTYTFIPAEPGTRMVTARITDPDGAQAVATPLALRIDPLTDGVPLIRLSKDEGYGRIVQRGVFLEEGKTYVFSCRVRGAFRAGLHDHLAEVFAFGDEPVYSEPQYTTSGGWTTFRRALTPTVTRQYDLGLATWATSVFEATDFELRESPGGANLLRNGDLALGLQDWESDGGRIELVHVSAEADWMPASGQLVAYQRFDGQIEMLRAHQGREVMLLVPDDAVFQADPAVVRKILHRLDESWDYFRRTTGQQPGTSGNPVSWGGQTHLIGLPTLAVVEESCGAGCGSVGSTGIEIGQAFWEETYNNAVAGGETRGLFEYEMGRNFWFFGHLFESAEVPTYHLGTAFATIYGYQAGVAAGSTEQPGNELVDWLQTYRDGFASYLAAPDWSLIRDGGLTGERIHGGLWLHLAEQYGEDWHGRFFRHAWQLESAASLEDAISNYIVAASVAARTNLYAFFTGSLDFPEVVGLQATVNQILADRTELADVTDDRYTVFNDLRSATLDVLDNDTHGPQGMLPPAIVAADGANQGGILKIGLGGHRVAYTPPAGFHGVETFTYTIGDVYGEIGQATVTVEVVKRWHNPVYAMDVNADNLVSAADVLDVINALNAGVPVPLPRMPAGSVAWFPYLDVTDDGKATALDVLTVINLLNNSPNGSVAIADDLYEPNDTLAQARDWGTILQTITVAGLQLRDSADWYQFTLPRAGTWRDAVVINFRHAAGDLDLMLYDSAGRELFCSQSITDTESISLAGLDPGVYFLRVFPDELPGTDYGLMIDLRP